MDKEIIYGESNKQALAIEAQRNARTMLALLLLMPEDKRDDEWQEHVNEMKSVLQEQKAND